MIFYKIKNFIKRIIDQQLKMIIIVKIIINYQCQLQFNGDDLHRRLRRKCQMKLKFENFRQTDLVIQLIIKVNKIKQ